MYWLGVRDYSNTDLCRHDEFPTLLDQVSSQRANGVVLVLDGIENIKVNVKCDSYLASPFHSTHWP